MPGRSIATNQPGNSHVSALAEKGKPTPEAPIPEYPGRRNLANVESSIRWTRDSHLRAGNSEKVAVPCRRRMSRR